MTDEQKLRRILEITNARLDAFVGIHACLRTHNIGGDFLKQIEYWRKEILKIAGQPITTKEKLKAIRQYAASNHDHLHDCGLGGGGDQAFIWHNLAERVIATVDRKVVVNVV